MLHRCRVLNRLSSKLLDMRRIIRLDHGDIAAPRTDHGGIHDEKEIK